MNECKPLSSGSSSQLQQLQHLAKTMQREVMRHDGFVKELTMDDKGLVMAGLPPPCVARRAPCADTAQH